MRQYTNTKPRRRRWVAVVALMLLSSTAAWAGPSQLQIARQFLLAVLSGKYDEAYRLLAPEVQAGVSPARFRTAAEPIYRQGQQRGARIDLYRLGLRIGDDDQVRWFYAFSFKSDSLVKVPQQLDVTFRDSAATGVLEFRMVPAAADGPSARPR